MFFCVRIVEPFDELVDVMTAVKNISEASSEGLPILYGLNSGFCSLTAVCALIARLLFFLAFGCSLDALSYD